MSRFSNLAFDWLAALFKPCLKILVILLIISIIFISTLPHHEHRVCGALNGIYWYKNNSDASSNKQSSDGTKPLTKLIFTRSVSNSILCNTQSRNLPSACELDQKHFNNNTFSNTCILYKHYYQLVMICGTNIHLGIVITWSVITQYCIIGDKCISRTQMIIWTHKRHPIAHPEGSAMGCLLWIYSLTRIATTKITWNHTAEYKIRKIHKQRLGFQQIPAIVPFVKPEKSLACISKYTDHFKLGLYYINHSEQSLRKTCWIKKSPVTHCRRYSFCVLGKVVPGERVMFYVLSLPLPVNICWHSNPCAE